MIIVIRGTTWENVLVLYPVESPAKKMYIDISSKRAPLWLSIGVNSVLFETGPNAVSNKITIPKMASSA